MKNSIMALVAALVLSFGYFGTVNADAPSIIESGVEEINGYADCYLAPDNASPVAASISAGEWVTTLESDVPGWRFIAYGDDYCWVWGELVGSLPSPPPMTEQPVASEVATTEPEAPAEAEVVVSFPSTGDGYGETPPQSRTMTIVVISLIIGGPILIIGACVYNAWRQEYGKPYHVDPADVASLQR